MKLKKKKTYKTPFTDEQREKINEYQRRYYRKRKGYEPEEVELDIKAFKKVSVIRDNAVRVEGICLRDLAEKYGVDFAGLYNLYHRHKDWTLQDFEKHYSNKKGKEEANDK